MSSSLQLLEDGEREPTSAPEIPEEGGRLLYDVKCANKRTNVVRLLPNGFQERKLRGLTSISAKPFDELYCEGRQGFFRRREVDLEGRGARIAGSTRATGCQRTGRRAEEGRGLLVFLFSSLLRLKKQKNLPPYAQRVGMPSPA